MARVKEETSYNVLVGFPTADQVIEMKNLHCKIVMEEGINVYERVKEISETVQSVRRWKARYPKALGEDNRGHLRDLREFRDIVKEVEEERRDAARTRN
jgi:hypothetical protein